MSRPSPMGSSSGVRCPVCGQPGKPIFYGMPSSEIFEEAERGEVELGGCIIEEETHRCPSGHEFIA